MPRGHSVSFSFSFSILRGRTNAETVQRDEDSHVQEMPQIGGALRGGGWLPGIMQHTQPQVPTSALADCSEELRVELQFFRANICTSRLFRGVKGRIAIFSFRFMESVTSSTS